MVHAARVGENTTPVLGYNLPIVLSGGRYYWRARAFDGQGHAYKRNEHGRADPKGAVPALRLQEDADGSIQAQSRGPELGAE